MSSDEEMFEKGVRDAEQDELNSFYYQHYYHYRRGYDRARRRIRRTPSDSGQSMQAGRVPVIGLVLLVVAALGVLAYGSWGRGGSSLARSTSTPVEPSSVAQAAVPTRIPRIPTDTPVPPTPLPPVLQVQGGAVVVNSGAPLRVRAGAGIKQKVVGRLPEGTTVKLVEGPVESDGYTWWHIEAGDNNGWVAERSQEGVVWLQPQ